MVVATLHLYTASPPYLHALRADDSEAIIDKVRFLASACDCKYMFLDHITMVVTGLLDADQTKLLDYLSK
jgi:hypothetical protein